MSGAAEDFFDGGDEGIEIFSGDFVDAGGLGGNFELGHVVEGEDDHRSVWQRGGNLAGELGGVEAGHDPVADDGVGLQFEGFLQGFGAVGSFAADLPSGMALEHNAQNAACAVVIVGNQNPGDGVPKVRPRFSTWREPTV
jgi:hypothetical protein